MFAMFSSEAFTTFKKLHAALVEDLQYLVFHESVTVLDRIWPTGYTQCAHFISVFKYNTLISVSECTFTVSSVHRLR